MAPPRKAQTSTPASEQTPESAEPAAPKATRQKKQATQTGAQAAPQAEPSAPKRARQKKQPTSGEASQAVGSTGDADQDHVARRAYELYEQRGRQHGRHEDDWHQAEQEIRGGAQQANVPQAKGTQKAKGASKQNP